MAEGGPAEIAPGRTQAATGSAFAASTGGRSRTLEALSGALLVALAFGARLWFTSVFPTEPISDFAHIVAFAVRLTEEPFAPSFSGWSTFGIGVPLCLSLVFRLVPGDPGTVARYATVAVTSLAALAPFLFWRGLLSLRARFVASALVSLWPGLVFVSGVVSQDNWVQLPTVVLVCLCVRAVSSAREAYPIVAALTFVTAGAMRQEMLLALLPAALGAAGLWQPVRRWPRAQALVFAAVTALSLGAVATMRWAGTGRFALTTEHGGLAVLGAATPGAGLAYWAPARGYVAALAPELVDDPDRLLSESWRLAGKELLRRPPFHAVRMYSAAINNLLRTDSSGTFWAIGADEALPPALRARGQALQVAAAPRLQTATRAWLLAVAIASALAVRWRSHPLGLVALCIFLKVAVHGVTAAQPRYFMVVTVLGLLSLGVVVDEWPRCLGKTGVVPFLIGGLLAAGLTKLGERAEAYVLAHDEQPTYRFALRSKGAWLSCIVSEGLLADAGGNTAVLQPMHPDPRPGETATASCRAHASPAVTTLSLRLHDDAPVRLRGRLTQNVEIEGVGTIAHDIADPDMPEGIALPLDAAKRPEGVAVSIRILAIAPEPGWSWNAAACTRFALHAS